MTIRRTSSFVSALVALVLAVSPSEAHACSSDEATVFVSPYVPDTPAARYVAGELGVLQPTWIRAYLVVAYREMAGRPLTPAELAKAAGVTPERADTLLTDLHRHLFFLVRDADGNVAWAFPVTVDPTPHRVTFSTGERLSGA